MTNVVVRIRIDDMECVRRRDAQEAADFVAFTEVLQVRVEIEVGQTVGVIGEKHGIVPEVVPNAHEPLADIRVRPGVHEGDPPILDIAAQ